MIEYQPVTPEILAQFKEISGSKVSVGEDINPDYTHDAMPIYGIGMPEVTIDVTTTEEIAAIMKICNENHIPVTVRGAGTGLGEDGANVTAASLKGCNLSAARIPDLVPILSVAMAAASGTSMLTDIGTSIGPVCETLEALGADVSYGGVGLSFTGRPFFNGGDIDPKGDPLVVMIAAAASCLCAEPVRIRNAGIVNKAYPDFFDDLAALGGKIRVEQ